LKAKLPLFPQSESSWDDRGRSLFAKRENEKERKREREKEGAR